MFVKSWPAVCANSAGAASGTTVGTGGTLTVGGVNAEDTVTLSSTPGSQMRYTPPGTIPVGSATLSDITPAEAPADRTVATNPAVYVSCVYTCAPAPGAPNCNDPVHGPPLPMVTTRLRPSSLHAAGFVSVVSDVGVYP